MTRPSLLALVICGGLLGCTPSIDSTCGKIVELANKELAAGKMADKKMAKSKDKCIADMTKLDEEDPEAYKCVARCVRAVSELSAAWGCESNCSHKEKKKDEK